MKRLFFLTGKYREREYGITLIELLVVIAVLGVLAGALITIIDPLANFKKARDAQRKSDIAQIQRGLEQFYSDWQKYPCFNAPTCGGSQGWNIASTLSESGKLPAPLGTSYMQVIPKDPVSGANCPGYLYAAYSSGQGYTIFAKLENTEDPTTKNLKSAPGYGAFGSGTCDGQVGSGLQAQCVTFTITSGSCSTPSNTTYNYWVNVP